MWQTNEMNLNSKFHNNIVNKYQIYNSLFLTLPYENIEDVGVLLPLLAKNCHEGFKLKNNPKEIIDDFFAKHTGLKNNKSSLLFKFIQYIERQVVSFDAVEDAAFEKIILPLITIQQYALMQVKELEKNNGDKKRIKVYEQIIIHAFFGSINTSRNPAKY